MGALVDGRAGDGIAVLAELDERGRDVAVVLDQVVDQIRTELTAAIAPGGDPARAGTLAAVRDTLLPKLISGELRVKDAERFVEQSA